MIALKQRIFVEHLERASPRNVLFRAIPLTSWNYELRITNYELF
jgi:hypothetical protein